MADPKQMVFVGQGPIAIGEFDATNGIAAEGYLVRQKLIGCGHRKLSFAHSRETGSVKEDCSGNRGTLATWTKGQEIKCSLELTQFSREDLAMGLYGQSLSRAAGTVTNEALRAGLAVGEVFHLKYPQASSVIIKDSAGSPATLVLDTDYAIDSADYGRIQVLNLGAYTQPLKVDYTHAGRTNIKMFSATGVVKGLIFEGISSVDGSRMRVLLPRISFPPTSEFQLVGDAVASLIMEGRALVADVSANDPILGAFGNIELL